MKGERFYLKSHEWIEFIDEKTARVGISDFAQQELGDIVFVNLPEVGDEVVAGEGFAEVESVKSISEVYSPVTGVVRSVNEKLQDSPELVNEDAYDAWFVEIGDISAKEELLNEEEYNEFLKARIDKWVPMFLAPKKKEGNACIHRRLRYG